MYQRKSAPYQPVSPPISSIASHKLLIDASVTLTLLSLYNASPAHSGSLWAFCHGAVGNVASDQRVGTVFPDTFVRAKLIAVSTSIKPSGGLGIR